MTKSIQAGAHKACFLMVWAAWAGALSPAMAIAAEPKAQPVALKPLKADAALKSVSSTVMTQGPVHVGAAIALTSGKSTLIRLPESAQRLSVANPEVADVMLVNPREVYLLGKKSGTTNVLIWTASGQTTLHDLVVGADVGTLREQIKEFVPLAENLRVESVANNLVVSGRVTDGMKAQRIMNLAEAFSDGKKVINLMRVDGGQQVMLEVKVAEVSRSLLDQLGVEFGMSRTIGNATLGVLSKLLSAGASTITAAGANGLTNITLNAEMKKGLVKILAEPTITAVNGQEGSFLAGGKIYIPVPQMGSAGSVAITLEEKEFGVGLRFLPTILEDGLINLRVTPEVSELSQTGTPITGLNGQSSLLPSITTRRASTTVQLRDGESFAIGGLIKSNVTETIKAFPVLGEIPVLGALFRSTAFQNEQSELLFIVTPRLAQPLPPGTPLPTDKFIPPSRSELFFRGRMEGEPTSAVTSPP
jgi:pilus assembly protein CpaC